MMKALSIIRLFMSSALLLMLCQCAGPGDAHVRHNVVYTPAGWPAPVLADLFRPAASEPVPAVVLIHHGGLKVQDDLRWQMRGLARKLARRGYFVMNVTYRNAPRWPFPAPMEDIDAALRWIEKNAAEESIDTGRIAIFGYSVGGHIALLKGLRDERVKAIVAGAAPADLMLFDGGVLVGKALGGGRDERPQSYRDASPLHHVHEGAPPVFLYHGSTDKMIPAFHSRLMKEALDAANVPNELHLLEGKGHIGAFLLGAGVEGSAIDFLDRILR